MRLAMVGLGRMGGNMARRLMGAGHEVVGYDVDPTAVTALTEAGAIGAGGLDQLVAQLRPPRAVWLMLPAGRVTQRVVDDLVPLLDRGDVIVDGGNARWTDTRSRAQELAEMGVDLVDAGVSGGVWGLENGYGLMVGGPDAAVERLRPVFEALAPADGGFVHVGMAGSGHYTKMVHNGIEYALMQAYGEGFALLASAPEVGFDSAKIAEVAEAWRHGTVIRSWLLDLAALALADPGFADVRGIVEDSGEGRWTVQEAVERGVSVPTIAASLFGRFSSREPNLFSNRVLAALRTQFGGHVIHRAGTDGESAR